MFYREAGQFKSTYAEDQQIFPIRQDRIAITLLLIVAFVVVPLIGDQYWLSALITPVELWFVNQGTRCSTSGRSSGAWRDSSRWSRG